MQRLCYIFLLIFTLTSFEFTYAQDSATPIQYVYLKTTVSAMLELQVLSKEDKNLYTSALDKVKELELKGKIILSSSEYNPIEQRIKNDLILDKNSVSYEEAKTYAEKVKQRYISITDLFKEM